MGLFFMKTSAVQSCLSAHTDEGYCCVTLACFTSLSALPFPSYIFLKFKRILQNKALEKHLDKF